MIRERGIALIEMIVVGFAVVLMVLPVIAMTARVVDATASVHAAARDAAVWVARHDHQPPAPEGISVSVVRRQGSVRVVASDDVVLIGVGGTNISRTVRSEIEVPVSPFRSNP
ncbi:MAG: hypothetical protein ABFR95_03255 [Actinomycetota bacterium]